MAKNIKTVHKKADLFQSRLFTDFRVECEIFKCIVDAVNNAPRNRQTAELHIQMIKYADELKSITSKEFCEETKFPIGYGSEFSKMRNITERLKAAGLDVSKL